MNYELLLALRKVDDLTIKVLHKSLLPADKALAISIINSDYLSDVGVVGLLRSHYLRTLNLEDTCRLYWESRLEPTSPRVESAWVQILLNVTASFVYDALKLVDIQGIIAQARQIFPLMTTVAEHAPLIRAHGAQIFKLLRLVQQEREEIALAPLDDDGRPILSSRSQEIVSEILVNRDAFLDDLIGQDIPDEYNILCQNLTFVSRGIVSDYLTKIGKVSYIPSGSTFIKMISACPGAGWGHIVFLNDFVNNFQELLRLMDRRDSILVCNYYGAESDRMRSFFHDFVDAISKSSAIISTEGMTGHGPVVARGQGKPATCGASEGHVAALRAHSNGFAVVNGDTGDVWLLRNIPDDLKGISSR